MNHCLLNLTYPHIRGQDTWQLIPKEDIVVVFDADMICEHLPKALSTGLDSIAPRYNTYPGRWVWACQLCRQGHAVSSWVKQDSKVAGNT
jgi:hypothetical protein